MKAVNPYLNFNGNTEEAFTFYKSVFGGEFLAVMRFKDFPPIEGMDPLPEADLNKIGHIAISLGSSTLMGTDALESMGHSVTVGNNFYIMLEPDSAEEAEMLFEALSAGGQVQMPLQGTDWAEKYGSLIDQFGVQWMVNYGGAREIVDQ